MLDFAQRRALVTAALGFDLLDPHEPELRLLHGWLDSWRGIGDVVRGMARQDYLLHLTNIDRSTWRATFSRDAMISAEGFGADQTPWGAVQRAAWEALNKTQQTG